ncbi:Eco57I restriction-modification methylase domain-containing protein [Segetibacter koreensis]|uniref:Eco57I restriction-modification methylase domain-containing protein n=1 Tax=Segetibacter koreensis TaxID=398037 RepID=UPI0003674A7E|nr:TaqI-like C-terminal specificity domain-containing protein [Segetibacter koreensis]
MDQQTLKRIFEKAYDSSEWIEVAKEVFKADNILTKPAKINLPANDWEATGVELGSFETTDNRQIGLYELTIGPKAQLHRNKKGMRELLAKVYKEDVDAALIVFVQGNKWRFSYVSEIYTRDDKGRRQKKSTDPKRYTYLLGEGERSKTAADRFAKVRTTASLFKTGVSLETLEEAFNVEKMSKDFFNAYRKHYGAFTAYLTGEDENSKEVCKSAAAFTSVFKKDKKCARDFVKKLLGRIVFMYFLEKKGWLGVKEGEKWGDGNENFLRDLFRDTKHKQNFHPNVLVPLFYETLNTDRKDELFKIDKSEFTHGDYHKLKIPFLNGGLFENDMLEADGLVLPEKLFADLFTFFDQYNFTVYEDSPDEHTVAVDPEMLGHIFENLLEDNKDKGAFYTPKEIVHYMCQESLIEYLFTKLNDQGETVKRESIEKLIKRQEAAELIEYDEAILKALREVKVCDPAIGSGAFPMGLLMEIYHAVEVLYFVSPDVTEKVWKMKDWNPAKVKSDIIQNSIYGVDIEKGAVDIARLRFWLSLVVDETKPQPLPNLDYKIVVGDSLLSKFENHVIDIEWNYTTSHGTADTKKLITEQVGLLQRLSAWQGAYYNHKINKEKYQRDIKNLKIDILINQLTLSRKSYRDKNKTIVPLDGFPLTAKQIKTNLENDLVIAEFDQNIQKLQTIKKDAAAKLEFFDWRLDFPAVMNSSDKSKEGFDIIIANPPYVDIKGLPPAHVKSYFLTFATCENRINLYSIFIEKSLRLLRNDASLCFIVPNSLLLNSSYKKIRNRLVNHLTQLIKLPDAIFENAIVETIIFQIKTSNLLEEIKGKVYPNDFKTDLRNIVFNSFERSQWREDPENKFNIFSDGIVSALLLHMEKDSVALETLADFSLGITPYDKYKGHTEEQIRNRVFHSDKKTSKFHVPMISGKNILPYVVTDQIEEYLEYGSWLGAAREKRFFIQPRIIVRQIISGNPPRIYAGYTSMELYFTQIGFAITTNKEDDLKYILCILNSKLMNFYHKYKYLDIEKNTFQKILIANCKRFPIKKVDTETKKSLSKLVDKIISRKTEEQIGNITEEATIDKWLYKIYALNYTEACLIEGNNEWMTKEEYEAFTLPGEKE